MLNPIVQNVPVYTATVLAKEGELLRDTLAGNLPGHPALETRLDENISSPTYLQEVPVAVGYFVTSTIHGNSPVTIAGRVSLARPRLAAELIVAGSHTLSTPDEIAQELERQRLRLAATQASDRLTASKGRIPFEIKTPDKDGK